MLYKPSIVIHRDAQKTEVQGEGSLQLVSDKELASRTREGDQVAAEELVRRYQQKAYAIAYHMCSGDSQEAEDLTQEAFFRAFRGIGKFRGESSFYTWFYRIVINTCLDGKRRRLRWERVFSFWRPEQGEEAPFKRGTDAQPARGEGVSPMAVLTGKLLSQKIRKAVMSLPERRRVLRLRMQRLRELPPEDRALFRRRFNQWQGLSPEEREKIRQNLEMWDSLSPQEQEEIRRKFHTP